MPFLVNALSNTQEKERPKAQNEFTIRPMIKEDSTQIKQVINLSFGAFFQLFATLSLQEKGQVLVSETQGKVVAFAKLIEFHISGNKFGCILWLAVHPQFRRRGVATALTNEGIQCLRQDGTKAIFVSVNRRNKASLKVLNLLGFKRIGFLVLWRLFRWRVFEFYRDIWYAPTEIVLMYI